MRLGMCKKGQRDWTGTEHISFWFRAMAYFNFNIVKKSTDTLLVTFKEICMELRAEKSKYVVRGS
jgi:hypothetical protein